MMVDDNGQPIPIIFRPFHEHQGDWFFWGRKHVTDADFIKIWRFTVDYLIKNKGHHNLLIAFSPSTTTSRQEYLFRYPGDDYVDILGIDDYMFVNRKEDRQQFIQSARMLVLLAREKGKIAALTETGLERIPNDFWFSKILLEPLLSDPIAREIAYAVFWRNADRDHHYAPFPTHPSSVDFLRFSRHWFTVFEGQEPRSWFSVY